MLGLFQPRKTELIEHWYTLIPGFTTSAKEFYESLEKELKERQVPGLDIASVEFAEGGILSAKRVYLRMTRERLVFDICAASFGTAYFFSCRFAQIPSVVKLWEFLALIVGLFIIGFGGLSVFGNLFGLFGLLLFPALFVAGIVTAIYLMRNAVAMGLKDLDATVLKLPVIGVVYEAWIRKETYYREDTRLMYCDTVKNVVKAKVEEVTSAKCVKLIQFNEYSPILGELYKPVMVTLPRT